MNPHTGSVQLSAPVRLLRSAVHAVVYHLLVKPAVTRTDTVQMSGLRLEIPPSVFHPKFYLTSRFFAGYIQGLDLEGKEVLEMGCGSGILSLVAARRGARVTAVDINPRAVECTAGNARGNALEHTVLAIQGDLFSALPARSTFDFILWSPPFYPQDPSDDAGFAWNAGVGYSAIRRFAESAGAHLRTGGKILLLLSTDTDRSAILSFFESNGFRMQVVRVKRKLFEVLSIHELRQSGKRSGDG